ncbi:hypothetical protein BJA5080_08424 [Bradyrhizobium diazoefficiens SEMIA 5080]|uniref:Uncharacterized protein n=1 Tax=Bradyrhizobium diazoefficiens SEMIA 5080 TaxID=754504 RepID=A0A837CK79_9BRAD|nr:hypothetical protein BJA5080_08424 [Bradyrhizobium diazoefficiens SEMIA 5080]
MRQRRTCNANSSAAGAQQRCTKPHTEQLSGRAVIIITLVGGSSGFPHLHERHREQIDGRGQADAARRLDGTRQVACQLLELVSP